MSDDQTDIMYFNTKKEKYFEILEMSHQGRNFTYEGEYISYKVVMNGSPLNE